VVAVVALTIGLVITAVVGATNVLDERDRTRAALAALERRQGDLLVERARAALASDPTEAAALLAALRVDAHNFRDVRAVLADAQARGVAVDVLPGHAGRVTDVEMSPDHRLAVSVDTTGELRLWRAGPDGVAGEVLADVAPVNDLAFDATGGRLAVVGERGADLVEVSTGAVTHIAGSAAVAPLRSVDFTADGAALVVGAADGTARLLLLAGGVAPALLEGTPAPPVDRPFALTMHSPLDGSTVVVHEDDRVAAVEADGRLRWLVPHPLGHPVIYRRSRDGAHLVTWTPDGTLFAWDAADGAVRPLARVAQVSDLALSPDGAWVAVGTATGEVSAYALADGARRALSTHGAAVVTLAWTAADQVASAGQDASLRVSDLARGETWALQHRATVTHAATFADGTLLGLSMDGLARVFAPTPRASRVFGGHTAAVIAVAVADDHAISVSRDRRVGLWSAGARPAGLLDGLRRGATNLLASADPARALVRDGDNGCVVVDPSAGTAVAIGEPGDCAAPSVLLPGSEPRVLALDLAGVVRLLPARAPLAGVPPLRRLAPRRGGALGIGRDGELLAIDADGGVARLPTLPGADGGARVVAAAAADTVATLFRGWIVVATDGAPVVRGLPAPVRGASDLRVSPDGRLVAVSNTTGDLAVVDLTTRAARTLRRGGSAVTNAAFSWDGRWLATIAGRDVFLWDLTTGTPRRLPDPGSKVFGLAFSRDGRSLVVGTEAGGVRLYVDELATPLPADPESTARAVAAATRVRLDPASLDRFTMERGTR
jgi:WD40 repeat protein